MWNVPGGACAANQVSVRAQLTDSGNLIGYVQMAIPILADRHRVVEPSPTLEVISVPVESLYSAILSVNYKDAVGAVHADRMRR